MTQHLHSLALEPLWHSVHTCSDAMFLGFKRQAKDARAVKYHTRMIFGPQHPSLQVFYCYSSKMCLYFFFTGLSDLFVSHLFSDSDWLSLINGLVNHQSCRTWESVMHSVTYQRPHVHFTYTNFIFFTYSAGQTGSWW